MNSFARPVTVDLKTCGLSASGLRTLVVTLDPKRNELQKDAPAAMLRALGHAVEVVGYDLAELKGVGRRRARRGGRAPGDRPPRDPAPAPAARAGRDPHPAVHRGGARLRAGSRDGRRRLHPDAGQRRRAGGAAAPAARARQAARARRCRSATARSCSTARCGRPTCAARRWASRPTNSSCCASSPIAWGACSRGRSCCRASGATATSAAFAPSTPTC